MYSLSFSCDFRDKQSKELKTERRQAGGFPISLKQLVLQSLVVGDMIEHARSIIKKNKNIKQFLKDFITKHNGVQLNAKDAHAIYLRKSKYTGKWNMIGNFPVGQFASCVSYTEVMLSQQESFLVIYEHEMDRSAIKRPGIIILITNILWGSVRHVIMNKTNRISSDYVLWVVLDEVCAAQKVTVHATSSIGKNYMEIVKDDSMQTEERLKSLATKNTAIRKMRDELDSDFKKLSFELLEMDRLLRSKFVVTNKVESDDKDSYGNYSGESNNDDDDDDTGDEKVAHKVLHTSRAESNQER